MNELRRLLSQEDALLFIGSGISSWSGLPSWKALLRNLGDFMEQLNIDANLVRNETQNGDLLQAASYGFDRLTPQQQIRFLRENCLATGVPPHEIHHLIVSLGPTSYVTTNFDILLERALSKWVPDVAYRVVLNDNFTELPEITSSRASHFLFKPHGDVNTPKSVILTREHYRRLLPDGDLHGALEALRVILVSRPVIYLGFGLRDPDFLYIRDILINTFKGAYRDHYAIVADATPEQVDYWRRQYSIHLITYPSTLNSDGSADHSALIDLLRSLTASDPTVDGATSLQPDDSHTLLAILRHLSRVAELQPTTAHLPLRVTEETEAASARFPARFAYRSFHGRAVEDLLTETQLNILLFGSPGTGKSYAMRFSASLLAKRFSQAFMSSSPDLPKLFIPIFIELRAYAGSIEHLVEQALPPKIRLHDLIKGYTVKLFFDGMDEVPRSWLEQGHWKSDLATFLRSHPDLIVVASSRMNEDLGALNFGVYNLNILDEEFVENELKSSHLRLTSSFSSEAYSLLRRPFYFNLILQRKIQLAADVHPRHLCSALISYIAAEISTNAVEREQIVNTLSNLAFFVIESGKDIFAAEALLGIASTTGRLSPDDAIGVVRRLVEKNFLIPYPGGSFTFFHKEVTEYLAASELTHRIINGSAKIAEMVTWRRWDHTLHITISLLPEPHSTQLFEELMRADFCLALTAPLYTFESTESLVSRILATLQIENTLSWEDTFQVVNVLRSYRFSASHIGALLALAEKGDMIGGAAAAQAALISGDERLERLLAALYEHRGDYNFCQMIVRELTKLPIETLLGPIERIIQRCDEEVGDDEDWEESTRGIIGAINDLLEEVPISQIEWLDRIANDLQNLSNFRRELCISVLEFSNDEQRKLEISANALLKRDIAGARIIGFLHVEPTNTDSEAWVCFTRSHIDACVDLLPDKENGIWVQQTLINLCRARKDLREYIEGRSGAESTITKACLLYAANEGSQTRVIAALGEILDRPVAMLDHEPLGAAKELELNWQGAEDLFFRLLRLRSRGLALALVDHYDLTSESMKHELSKSDVFWFINWMAESADEDHDWFFRDRMGRFLAESADLETFSKVLSVFDQGDDRVSRVVADYILQYRQDLTTDMLSRNALDFLKNSLKSRESWNPEGPLLGAIATEEFVERELLPLLTQATGEHLLNLKQVLQRAGMRFGRRFTP
jgi:hypothetical protein